jgi:hypothetical protein
MNSKSQIGPTLLWFGAFIIIFFILIGFVYLSTAIGVKKQVESLFFSDKEVVGVERLSEDSAVMASLFAVLNEQIVVNGSEERFLEALLTYEGYNDAVKANIENNFRKELSKTCLGYRFRVNDLEFNSDSSGEYTKEVIFPVYYNFNVFLIKYSQLRSC